MKELTEIAGIPVYEVDKIYQVGDGESARRISPAQALETAVLFYRDHKMGQIKKNINDQYGSYDKDVLAQTFESLINNLRYYSAEYVLNLDFSFSGDDWFMIVSSAIDEGYRFSKDMTIEKWLEISLAQYLIKHNRLFIDDLSLSEGEWSLVDNILKIARNSDIKKILA